MGKILRGRRAAYLKIGDMETWAAIGKDSEDLSTDNQPTVNQKKNVHGETITEHEGYSPTMGVDSYFARSEDPLYPVLQKISNELSTDEAVCGGELIVGTFDIEVKDTGVKTATGEGYKVPVLVTANSDGGGTAGYQIPYTVYENGARVQGSITVTNKQPTFTERASTPSSQNLGGGASE